MASPAFDASASGPTKTLRETVVPMSSDVPNIVPSRRTGGVPSLGALIFGAASLAFAEPESWGGGCGGSWGFGGSDLEQALSSSAPSERANGFTITSLGRRRVVAGEGAEPAEAGP